MPSLQFPAKGLILDQTLYPVRQKRSGAISVDWELKFTAVNQAVWGWASFPSDSYNGEALTLEVVWAHDEASSSAFDFDVDLCIISDGDDEDEALSGTVTNITDTGATSELDYFASAARSTALPSAGDRVGFKLWCNAYTDNQRVKALNIYWTVG